MSKKMIESISSERRRVKDLDKLKKEGGPFTKPEEVEEFIASDLYEKEKQERLYIEVRFARDTTLSLPKKSELFRLKEKYKSLACCKFKGLPWKKCLQMPQQIGMISTPAVASLKS